MEFSSYQLGVLVVGVVAFLLGVAGGISFALGHQVGAGIALVLSAVAWAIAYAITAGRAREH